MGNFYMESTQINYRRDEKTKTVDQKLQELSETSAIDTDIAPVFKSTNTYQPGDMVYYRNKLYVFNVEHTGTWAAADVTATDVTTEISSLKSGLTNVESRIEAVENGVDLIASVIAGEHVTIDTTTSYIIKAGCIVVCMFSLTATQNLSINDEILLTNMPIPSKTRVVQISCGSKQFQCSVNTSGVFKFSYSDNTLQLGETAKMMFTYPL